MTAPTLTVKASGNKRQDTYQVQVDHPCGLTMIMLPWRAKDRPRMAIGAVIGDGKWLIYSDGTCEPVE